MYTVHLYSSVLQSPFFFFFYLSPLIRLFSLSIVWEVCFFPLQPICFILTHLIFSYLTSFLRLFIFFCVCELSLSTLILSLWGLGSAYPPNQFHFSLSRSTASLYSFKCIAISFGLFQLSPGKRGICVESSRTLVHSLLSTVIDSKKKHFWINLFLPLPPFVRWQARRRIDRQRKRHGQKDRQKNTNTFRQADRPRGVRVRRGSERRRETEEER